MLIFQIPIDKINAIMTSYGEWEKTGLGASGEAYLVGADGRPALALSHDPEDFHFRIANDAGDRIYFVTIHAAKTTDTGDTPKTAGRGPALLTTPWEADPWDADPDVLFTISKLGL